MGISGNASAGDSGFDPQMGTDNAEYIGMVVADPFMRLNMRGNIIDPYVLPG